MAADTSGRIKQLLNNNPMVASELYDVLERNGTSREVAKAAVARLIRSGSISRAQLSLGRGNSILFSGPVAPNPDLARRLIENGFFGRKAVAHLILSLQSSHAGVSRYDVAKPLHLRLGVQVPETGLKPKV